MKLTTHGVLPRLTAIMLSALICVACNSEPEPEPEPETDPEMEDLVEAEMAEMAGDTALSETATENGCILSIAGAPVDTSSLDADNVMVTELGGLCEIANTVLGAAAEYRRAFVETNDCTFTEESTEAAAPLVMDRGSSVLGKLLVPAPGDDAETEKRVLAQSICEDESIMDWAVAEYLKSADLTVYSIGLAAPDDVSCPAIVWSMMDDEQGQVYNVAGPENCSDIVLPHAQLFNPEQNPDGQLTGDYIRQVVGYSGNLPDEYDFKGGRFPFLSDEPLVHNEAAQPELMAADRSLLGDDAHRYIFWVTGEENVDNEYFTAEEALTRHYHVTELRRMIPDDRALTALQRSYGAPVIKWVMPVASGAQPGIHVAIATSSGDEFVMIVEPAGDMNEIEQFNWLAGARPELLVLQEIDEQSGEYLILEGALFTDGTDTVLARLEACECDSQGFLGWLGKEQMALNTITEQLRRDFIARERSTVKSRDWTVSSELGPRAVGYSLSSRSGTSRRSDAAFVVHDGGAANSLYVATDSMCGDQSLLFSFGSDMMNLPADCREIENQGVVYSLLDESSDLMNAMQNGSTMIVAVTERASRVIQKEYPFSLVGAAQAIDSLDDDEAGFSEPVMKRYRGLKLSSDAEIRLFELLEKRTVPCSSGSTASECVVEADAPAIAAARPVARTRRPVVVDPDPVDYAPGYAQVIAEQLGSGKQSECTAVVEEIMQVARASGTPDSRARKIDLIVGGAPNSCFGIF